MSRTPYEDHNGQAGSVSGNQTTVFQADGQGTLSLPGAEFVQDAELMRDGQDLVLEAPDGSVVVIEGYFNADPAPQLVAPGGETLTPDLVQAFVQQAGPLNYADAGSMYDATPVGAVQEISGEATVTRPNGTTESIRVGTPIYEGDIIETTRDGAVNIEFIDESTFAVSQNARLAIDEYIFDPASESGTSDFSILRGIFVFTSGLIGRDDPDDVTLETPMGSIGIRGTVIAGNIDTGEITVMEGAIVLRDFSGNEVTLAEQYETARFEPATGEISYLGKISTDSFTTSFDTVKPVAPDLFNALAPNAGLSAPSDAMTPEQPAPAPPSTDFQTAPESTDTQPQSAPSPETSTEGTLSPTGTISTKTAGTNTSFDGTTETTFDQSAGTDTSLTNTSLSGTTTNVTTTTTTTSTAPTGTTSAPRSTTTDTALATDTTSPPPSVISGGTAPPPPNPHHISLKAIIDHGSNANGFFVAGGANQHLGDYIAAAGDYQNDGTLDFFVAEGLPSTGEFYVYDRSGTDQTGGGIPAPGTPSSNMTVTGVGDMDGDGTVDFITGAPDSGAGYNGNAQIYLSASGLSVFSGQDDNSGGSVTTDNGDMLGESIAGIGDINGDGYNDLLIGAPGRDGGSQDDAGAAYVVFGSNAMSVNISIDTIGTDGIAFNGTNTGDYFGQNVAGAGDLNNDGYADFMISRPGQGTVDVYFGDDAGTSGMKTITGIAVDLADASIPLFDMGDMNGDGISDIGLASTNGSDTFYVLSGASVAAAGATISVTSAMTTVTPDAGFEIVGGGAAGDFNGDGMTDAILGFQNGTNLEVFVVYGGRTGSMSMADLTNPENAFHMSLDLTGYNISDLSQFDLEAAGPGDLNGDGFDDIVLGMSDLNNGNGGFVVINGRNADAKGADGNMVHIAGQTTQLNDVIANAANQHLVGNTANNTLQANGFANIDMRGGDGNDTFVLNNSVLGDIDGGSGSDIIKLFGSGLSLDFSAMGSESLSGIEKFAFQNTSQTITIGMDDIFRLAQESHEMINFGGDLRKVVVFSNQSGGAVNLNIEDNALPGTPFTLGTPDDSSTVAGYDAYFMADGYALLIDQNNITEAVI